MKKISFDEKTIKSIQDFINEGHTLNEVCNRFTIKYDTLRRVMRENGLTCYNKSELLRSSKVDDIQYISSVVNLFKYTNMRLQDICKECKLEYWEMLKILENNFTKKELDQRKSKLYRLSKADKLNPINYKEIIEDGNGYLLIKKPDWYTGRSGSEYIFYHSYVMCKHLNISEIPKGFVVHHIDGNKKKNDISNLALMSVSGHGKIHSIQRNLCKVQRLSDNGVGSNSETPNNGC